MTDVAEAGAAERRTALIVLLIGACIIGLAPILVRLADSGPAAVGFWRMVFALPLLFLLAQRETGGVGRAGPVLLLAGGAFALDLAFWHYGIALTSVAKATILSNLTPVIVTGIAWLVFRERIRPLFLAAVVLAVGGACIMTLARDPGLPGANPALGDAYSAMTAVWYALYFLAVQRARQSRGAAQVMFWSSLTAAPLLAAASGLLGERFMPATPGGWAACIGLGVMHVTGQGSIAWALGRLPASVTSVVVLVQPVVAAILGWVLFGEVFGPGQMLGGAIALVHVAIDNQDAACLAFGHQPVGGDGEIIGDAITGTAIRPGMMAAAGAIGRPAVGERMQRCGVRAAGHQPRASGDGGGNRQADAAFHFGRHGCGEHGIDIGGIMHGKHVGPAAVPIV